MALQLEEVTVTGQGLTLSQLVWRRVQSPYPGQVEAVLEANRHLAEKGFILPVGTIVKLPPAPSTDATATVDPIRLW